MLHTRRHIRPMMVTPPFFKSLLLLFNPQSLNLQIKSLPLPLTPILNHQIFKSRFYCFSPHLSALPSFALHHSQWCFPKSSLPHHGHFQRLSSLWKFSHRSNLQILKFSKQVTDAPPHQRWFAFTSSPNHQILNSSNLLVLKSANLLIFKSSKHVTNATPPHPTRDELTLQHLKIIKTSNPSSTLHHLKSIKSSNH